ncbi:50S ribosomal protein L13 [Candidatus Bathyarchaeota archaeon]|nr:MAG: 50S ribosomal protein L13 [Candidatus Bathyarchaeota archaeon]
MGRLASVVAKRLLNGEKIAIINAEKAVISGEKRSIIREFKEFLEVGSVINPKYGPIHPRRPDNILRRVVRGMLPMDKAKGRKAFKRLKVYINIPPEVSGRKIETIPEASASKLQGKYVYLGLVAKEIGWKEV